jgi:opacity protein-like surface antigen
MADPPRPAPSQYEDLSESSAPTVAARAPDRRHWHGPDLGLQVGGGVVNYGSSQMEQLTRPGGYWDARLVLGMRQVFAFELAYVGAMSPLNAPGVAPGSTLYRNGAEGDLRLNAPLLMRDGAYVLPYALAGMGWERFHIGNGGTDGRVLARNDDVVTVPVGGGVSIGYRHLFIDTRFTYRFTQHEDLLAAAGPSSDRLRNWSFGGNFGYLF